MSFNVKNRYSFPSGKFFLKFQTAIITGVARSGKSTLGNLLATHKNVEYYEEPWILNLLSAMVKLRMIDKEIGKDMFVSYLHELMNDMILLRQANFRPDDLGAIWKKKTAAEIFSRLTLLRSRTDVKNFVVKNKSLCLLALRESPLFNLPTVFNFLPDCKIIHVIRKGIDVAYQIQEKGWLSDEQLIRPPHARIYYPVPHKAKIFYVPSWIAPEEAEKFINYSEYERGLLYWCSLMENMAKSLDEIGEKIRNIITMKFEDIIENPAQMAQKASSFLNISPSAITETALREVLNYNKNISKKSPKLTEDLFARTKKLYEYLEYDWN